MKRLLLFLLMTGCAFGTTATITGTITDLSGALVTSGQVTFSLQPSVDTTISGVTRFVPSTTTCGINGSGLVKNLALGGACVVTTNTSLTPSGTSYLVCIWPGNVKTSCFVTYITGDVDITTVNPTPTTSPLYNLVDTLNNQTIAGNKTFSGTTTLSGNAAIGGNETVAGTLGVTGASTLTGAVAAGSTMTVATSLAINGGTALTTTNRTGTGNLVLATSPTIATPTLTSPTSTGTDSGTETLTNKTLNFPTLVTPTASNAILATGVYADASGFKHKRVSTGSIAGTSNGTVTVTWGTAFVDAVYTAVCTVSEGSGAAQTLSVSRIVSQTASAITVPVFNSDGSAHTGTLHCIAVHD